MSKLKDVNLRWSHDDDAPEWFWKSNITEFCFYREIRSLKIDTPGFVKINVYWEPHPSVYDGEVFDGVTDVQVAAVLDHVEQRSASELAEFYVSLMADGVKMVLEHFGVATAQVDEAARAACAAALSLSFPLGKRAERIDSEFSVRACVRALPDWSACIVVLVVLRARAPAGELNVCTTHPSPEIALEAFQSLRLEGEAVVLQFRTVAGNRLVYGRRKFDHQNMTGVQRIDEPASSPSDKASWPTFRVAVSDLVGRGVASGRQARRQ